MDLKKKSTLFWIWLMMVVAYLDRTNITVAGPAIQSALHIGHRGFGFVLSAFTLGYALMQVPGGFLADRFGPRRILVGALIAWSVFTALTGIAWSLASLIVMRILFGIGEGFENGAQFKLIADIFQSRERSMANALFLTALALGPALGAPLTGMMVPGIGWRHLFLVFAVVGVIVAVLLGLFLPRQEKAIAATPPAGSGMRRDGIGASLKKPEPWLAFAAYGFFNIAFWGIIGWMPTFLHETWHVTSGKLGTVSAIPYVCGFLGMLVMGRFGEGSAFPWRATVVGCGYILAALFLAATNHATRLIPCVVGFSAAAFFLYGGFGPFWATAMDLIPEESRGALAGFINLGGQIGGFIAPTAIGLLLAGTKSYTAAFLFMAAGLVLSAICLFALQARTSTRSGLS